GVWGGGGQTTAAKASNRTAKFSACLQFTWSAVEHKMAAIWEGPSVLERSGVSEIFRGEVKAHCWASEAIITWGLLPATCMRTHTHTRMRTHSSLSRDEMNVRGSCPDCDNRLEKLDHTLAELGYIYPGIPEHQRHTVSVPECFRAAQSVCACPISE
ncbi:hypothetical protein ANANG_G00315070, partial [Anguilla anguilla]